MLVIITKNNKVSKGYKHLLFLPQPLMMNIKNLGSKENVGLNVKTAYAPNCV